MDRNSNSGDLTCATCGMVQLENPIVSEVQFGESAAGAAIVQGSMIGHDQVRANFGGRLNGLESREQTLSNGKRKIRKVAVAMSIPDRIAEAAGQWFELALTQNFVQGRRSQNVYATCLYVACRKEKTRHMLIDFSSRLQISVFSLGATFLKMVKALNISQLPLADPSLFIQHFAEKLEFKEKTNKVIKDAVKLAQRMNNDWIHEGRRPAGIAGACIMLAARMNNFRRSHAEIVAVAHVGEDTLQRRLNEFKKTKAASLTILSFRNAKMTERANPPSFDKKKVTATKIKEFINAKEESFQKFQKLYRMNQLKQSENAPVDENLEIDPEILRSSNHASNISSASDTASNTQLQISGEQQLFVPAEDNQSLTAVDDAEKLSKTTTGSKFEMTAKEKLLKSILMDCDLTEDEIMKQLQEIVTKHRKKGEKDMYAAPSDSLEMSNYKEVYDVNRPRNLLKYLPKTSDVLAKVSDDLDDIDDEELDVFILGPEEQKVKEQLWIGLNHDYLIEQERRKLKEEADELTGNTSGSSRKRRKQNRKKEPGLDEEFSDQLGVSDAIQDIGLDEKTGQPLSAVDSAKLMISKKAFSKKINYQSLEILLNDNFSKS